MAKHAVCIGINDYPGTGSDLAGCVNDARDWADALSARGFSSTLLLDAGATGADILAAIAAAVGQARYGDTVVITYSGHGSYQADQDGDESDGRDELWCPYDLWTKGPIVDDDLHVALDARKYGARVIVISDSCFSGTVLRFAAPLVSHERSRRARFLPPSTFLAGEALRTTAAVRRAPRVSRWRSAALLLSGCSDQEYSYDAWFGNRANGAFTRVALDALRQLDGQQLSYRGWFDRIRTALPSSDYPQTPQLEGSLSQMNWEML